MCSPSSIACVLVTLSVCLIGVGFVIQIRENIKEFNYVPSVAEFTHSDPDDEIFATRVQYYYGGFVNDHRYWVTLDPPLQVDPSVQWNSIFHDSWQVEFTRKRRQT